MTVYLIATPTIDRRGRTPNLEPASRYGDIKAVLDSGDYPTFHPLQALRKIYQKLESFDPAKDHLMWAGGDTLAAVMVGSVLSDYQVEEVNWLRFDRGWKENGERDNENGLYVPVKVPLYIPE